MIADNKDMIDKVQEELKVDQNIEAILRLVASPKEIFAEGAAPLIS